LLAAQSTGCSQRQRSLVTHRPGPPTDPDDKSCHRNTNNTDPRRHWPIPFRPVPAAPSRGLPSV